MYEKGDISREEYEQMKLHTVIGADILSPIEQLREMIPAVRWHHDPERAGAHETLAHALFVAEKVSAYEFLEQRFPRPDRLPIGQHRLEGLEAAFAQLVVGVDQDDVVVDYDAGERDHADPAHDDPERLLGDQQAEQHAEDARRSARSSVSAISPATRATR